MKLKQVTINQFKSIKTPLEILLSDEYKFYAFIGKNGSGKTNILQAVKQALQKKNYHTQDKATINAEYLLEITDDEKKQFFDTIEVDREIRVYSDGKTDAKMAKIPALKVSVQHFKERMLDIIKNFNIATENYLNELGKLEKDYNDYALPQFSVEKENTNFVVLDGWEINHVKAQLENQLEQIKKCFDDLFKEGDLISVHGDSRFLSYYHSYLGNIPFYQIAEENTVLIDPILAKALNLKGEELEEKNKRLREEIREINSKLKAAYDGIKRQIDLFEGLKKEIELLLSTKEELYYQTREKIDKLQNYFMESLRNAIYRTTYYIDNENTLLFSSDEQDYYRGQKQFDNLNLNNPIVSALDGFLKEKKHYRGDESLLKLSDISEERIHQLVNTINKKFLKKIIPGFDKNEVQRFSLKYQALKNQNGTLQLFVKEKNGDVIPFNQTSLGRRWYLTYLFVKQLLKEGDCLFIDEPAAFLHPQAQEEIRDDLIRLSQKGIYVFIATHSPYMMPDNWNQIYNVTMEENGTRLQSFFGGDESCEIIKEELGINTTKGLLFNLSKTLLLVEGAADKTCIEKFAELLRYDLTNYHIHICDGHSILQLCYLCNKYNFPYRAILDEDNKYKGELFKQSHIMYKECLQSVVDSPEKCIFIGEGHKGALEDYFIEENNKFSRYDSETKKWKISPRRVKKAKSREVFKDTTLRNFEQLFIKLGIPKIDKYKEI